MIKKFCKGLARCKKIFRYFVKNSYNIVFHLPQLCHVSCLITVVATADENRTAKQINLTIIFCAERIERCRWALFTPVIAAAYVEGAYVLTSNGLQFAFLIRIYLTFSRARPSVQYIAIINNSNTMWLFRIYLLSKKWFFC